MLMFSLNEHGGAFSVRAAAIDCIHAILQRLNRGEVCILVKGSAREQEGLSVGLERDYPWKFSASANSREDGEKIWTYILNPSGIFCRLK